MRTVVFLPLISTARTMAEELNKLPGIRAAEVDGGSKDRAEVIAGFRDGTYNVICNAMLLTEGWDCPEVDCVVILRPTKSRSLYAQMVGRGTRTAPGKERLALLDFLWQTTRHDLCKPASLVAKDEKIAAKMTAAVDAAGEAGIDLMEAEDQAERDVVAEREASLARELAANRRKAGKLVDPIQYALSIEDADLADYEPVMPSDMLPPSKRQLDAIENFGMSTEGVDCFGLASLILDRLVARAKANMATPKQIRML